MAEIAGAISDYVVYSSSSPSGADFFTKTDGLIENFETLGRVIVGRDGLSSLAINIDSLVLNIAVDDLDEGIRKIEAEMVPFLKEIMKKFDIGYVNRVGTVFEFESDNVQKTNKVSSKTTGGTFDSPENFALRFSQREKDLTSYARRDILDYVNYIFTAYKKDDKDVVKFDYQFYYKPELKSVNEVDFKAFLETAKSKFESKSTWIMS